MDMCPKCGCVLRVGGTTVTEEEDKTIYEQEKICGNQRCENYKVIVEVSITSIPK